MGAPVFTNMTIGMSQQSTIYGTRLDIYCRHARIKELSIMAKQENMSFADFRECFSNEDACREYLFILRWPNGFICPKCGVIG